MSELPLDENLGLRYVGYFKKREIERLRNAGIRAWYSPGSAGIGGDRYVATYTELWVSEMIALYAKLNKFAGLSLMEFIINAAPPRNKT